MKTLVFCIIFLMLFLFTDTKLYKDREVRLELKEQELQRGMRIFDSTFNEGVRLERELDTLKLLINDAGRKVDKLKNKRGI